jgi:60 kDa SS-A/Ro ribonucleoprotein
MSLSRMGGGGIFTCQCLEFTCQQERERPDRIVVFSDSQDCDLANKQPQPFGCRNYIIDISAHQHGINYRGVWTAKISGWSEYFLIYIAAIEAAAN